MKLTADSTIADLLIEAGKRGEEQGTNPVVLELEIDYKMHKFEIKLLDMDLTEEDLADSKLKIVN